MALALVVGLVAWRLSDDATERATPRGLAAAVLTHLDADRVGEVAVAGDGSDDVPLTISIATGDPALGSLFVLVTRPGSPSERPGAGATPATSR